MKKLISVIILASLTAGLFALPNLLKKEEFGAAAIDNLDFDLSWEDLVVKETYDPGIHRFVTIEYKVKR